jgi:diguanylate cyclase (GGDEF)-like protein
MPTFEYDTQSPDRPADNTGIDHHAQHLDENARKQREARIEKLTLIDALTGVANEAHIIHLLEKEIHRARRYGTPFGLAQVDIDQFLPFCEIHGQHAGDQALADFGRLLRSSIRETDMVGRIGNDEFLILLPNVCLNDAMIGVERIRALIEAHEFADTGRKITISGGVTEYTGESAALLIERSKVLLAEARESGRNRICLDREIS